MDHLLQKYARLLVDYCLSTKPGDRMYLRSTTLAEPLLREVFRLATRRGAKVDTDLSFREQGRIFLEEAQSDEQLQHISPLYKQAMEEYDTYLYIMAPYNLREDQNVDVGKRKTRQQAFGPIMKRYFERTATLDMRRSLCQYPTLANAQEAGMALEEYQDFVYRACRLYDDDPIQSWNEVREHQQKIVDLLNSRSEVHYKGDGIDIKFRTDGRSWINSDGKTNMPSGEVYTSPVEDSVNGHIHFSYPGLYMGREVEGVTLYVKDGYVERWEARRGKDFLDEIFEIDGARRFGEAAIGTNYNITQISRNILFDEKIGGSVHMAIGQSYLQAGGKNQSTVHWDMITDMTQQGEIYADGELIYEKGKFLFL